MIWIIFGEDQYRAQEKVKELRGDKPTILEVPPATTDEIVRNIGTGSLFEPSRSVVVRNFFTNSGAQSIQRLMDGLAHVPKGVTIIFWEEGSWPLTERETASLRKNAKFLGFPTLRGPAVHDWIKGSVRTKGGRINDDAAHLLVSLVGSDLARTDSEVGKLVAAADGKVIDVELISKIVSGDIPIEVFALVDAIAVKNASALSLLEKLLENGEEPLRILSLLATLSRNLLLVHDAGEKGSPSALGMHPFVFQKIKAAAKGFRYEELYEFHKKILATDVAIKTGKMDPDEALSALVASQTLG